MSLKEKASLQAFFDALSPCEVIPDKGTGADPPVFLAEHVRVIDEVAPIGGRPVYLVGVQAPSFPIEVWLTITVPEFVRAARTGAVYRAAYASGPTAFHPDGEVRFTTMGMTPAKRAQLRKGFLR